MCDCVDFDFFQRILVSWTDELGLSLVLTTGGTGLSPRDVTPEVLLQLYYVCMHVFSYI